MNKIKKRIIAFIAVTAAIFYSCTTTGDISLSGQRGQMEENLYKVETAVVPLEAAGPSAARFRQSQVTAARQLIAEMERESVADADYSGRLLAWSGRLAIIEGRNTEAQRLYRQSGSTSSGNLPSIILGIKLENDPAKRLVMIDNELRTTGPQRTGAGELNIERGRTLADLNRFSESAGAFDTAFASGINPVYRESYSAYRNRAWELRNTAGISSGTFAILLQDTINWLDCISIIKNETQLLRFMTGGRNTADTDLYNRLLDRTFIPYTQNVNITNWPITKPGSNETVTRAGAAFIIWHLFAEARASRSLLSAYSSRYARGENPRSPIADVPVLTPFFDSILGCVEREFMSLPDGRNFRPEQPIRGAELLTILRKIEP